MMNIFGESTARAFICRAVLHLYILKYCEPYRWHASLRIQHVSPTYIYKYIHITSLYVHVDPLLLDLRLFTCLLAHRLWTCIVCFARKPYAWRASLHDCERQPCSRH